MLLVWPFLVHYYRVKCDKSVCATGGCLFSLLSLSSATVQHSLWQMLCRQIRAHTKAQLVDLRTKGSTGAKPSTCRVARQLNNTKLLLQLATDSCPASSQSGTRHKHLKLIWKMRKRRPPTDQFTPLPQLTAECDTGN